MTRTYKGFKRLTEIERLHAEHPEFSLCTIAGILGISRQRAYQIVKNTPLFKDGRRPRPPKPCIQCGAETRMKYCSRPCMEEYRRAHKKPPLSQEEKRRQWNESAKKYYHAHKSDPAFRAKIKKYNTKSHKKRMQRLLDKYKYLSIARKEFRKTPYGKRGRPRIYE